jgi:carbamoyltransferase
MIKWGMVGNSHDASLAVFETKIAGLTDRYRTKLRWASLAKDFSGVPNDPDFHIDQLDFALEKFGPPSEIIWYERPFLKTLRQLKAGQGWLYNENNIKKYLRRWDINIPISYTQHHLSHAAYAYYTQPHKDCAIICLDSIGEFETLTMWHGKNGKLKKIFSQGYPHSLGLWYSSMTQRIGLEPQRDEYQISLMGKDGDPKRLQDAMIKDLFSHYPTLTDPRVLFKENLHRGCRWWRENDLKTKKDMNDIAAATQNVFEDIVKTLSAWVRYETGSKNLALAGGGALNRDAVDKIRPQWNNVHVPKNPGDPGSCIGAVLAKSKTFVSLDNVWHEKV